MTKGKYAYYRTLSILATLKGVLMLISEHVINRLMVYNLIHYLES